MSLPRRLARASLAAAVIASAAVGVQVATRAIPAQAEASQRRLSCRFAPHISAQSFTD